MPTKEEIDVIIGSNIRSERMARSLSIKDLAGMLGMEPAYLGLIERGGRGITAYTCYEISEILGVTIDRLISQHEEKPLTAQEKNFQKREMLRDMISLMDEKELDFMLALLQNI